MTDAPAITVTDAMDPARMAALAAVLGVGWRAGDPVLPFGHHVHFWMPEPPARLGRDGHPRQGVGPIPDTGLPRRMWAGGRLEFQAPLWPGRPATRRTRCEGVVHKAGRSGPLAFVTLRHDITQDGGAVLTEWQDLVYRSDPAPGDTPPAAPRAEETAEVHQPVDFDAVTLFRFSALTFNGHRIHYDADYARDVEGYAGPVVHGPLLAQRLILMAAARLGGRLRRFSFRATAPLILGEQAALCAAGAHYWVRAGDGRLCMTAEAG